MIRVLWLTSWYPNRLDKMNGDFIQRHARAVSLFCKVDVIHFEPDKENILQQKLEVSVIKNENLSETIGLYKLYNGEIFFAKLLSLIRYTTLFKKLVHEYILENGLPQIVHVHVPMKAGIIAWWLKRKYNIPYVVTEHWAIYNDKAADAFYKRSWLFKYYTKKILRNASAFLPVSYDLGKAVKQIVCKIDYTVVPNVADTALFNDSGISFEKAHFRFVHVSTMKPQKNPEGIIRAFGAFYKQFPSTELLMVGEHSALLEQLAASTGLPKTKISFTGLVSYDAVASILKESDALLMFSRFENMPCVIIEALCCGLPVISTNVGGIKEIIDDTNGLLVESEDETALLNAMISLYKQYGNYNRRDISVKAQKEFNYYTIGEMIAKIYNRVLNKTSRIQ